MHVVPHHAEVRDAKAVALLGAHEESKEKVANLAAIEKHLASIDARRDVASVTVPRGAVTVPGPRSLSPEASSPREKDIASLHNQEKAPRFASNVRMTGQA